MFASRLYTLCVVLAAHLWAETEGATASLSRNSSCPQFTTIAGQIFPTRAFPNGCVLRPTAFPNNPNGSKTINIYYQSFYTGPPGDSVSQHEPVMQSFLQEVEDMNYIPGYTIALHVYDDLCTPQDAIAQAIRGFSTPPQKHFAVMTTCSGALASGGLDALLPFNVVQSVAYSSASSLSDRQRFPYMIRTYPTIKTTVTLSVDLVQIFGWVRITLLDDDLPLTVEAIGLFESQMLERRVNWTRVERLKYRVPQDARPLAAKVKALDARIIIAALYDNAQVLLMAAWMEVGVTLPFWQHINVRGITFPKFVQGNWALVKTTLGDNISASSVMAAWEGLIGMSGAVVDFPITTDIHGLSRRRFMDIYKTQVDGNAAFANGTLTWDGGVIYDYDTLWAAAWLFREYLIVAGKSLETMATAASRDWLFNKALTIDFAGLTGQVQYANVSSTPGKPLMDIGNRVGPAQIQQYAAPGKLLQRGTKTNAGRFLWDGQLQWSGSDPSKSVACADGLPTASMCTGWVTPDRNTSCPAGSIYSELRGCVSCVPGTAAALGDQGCSSCGRGTFAQASGMSRCEPCAPGTFNTERGAVGCLPCARGSTSKPGAEECQLCERGTYTETDGAPRCTACPVGLSTFDRGSRSPADCMCGPENYFAGDATGCLPCPAGMVCPGRRDPPLQQAGFYARRSQAGDQSVLAFEVFKCSNAKICPDRMEVGACPQNRVGLACGMCLAGTFAAEHGGCDDCANVSIGLQISGISVGFVVLTVVAVVIALKADKLVLASSAAAGCSVTIFLASFQTVSAFAGLQVAWGDPLSALRGLFKLAYIDVELIQPSCFFHVGSAIGLYVVSLLAMPAALALLFVVHVSVHRCTGRKTALQETWSVFFNLVGRLMWSFFLSITLMSLAAFQCVVNPSGPSTLQNQRSVICWQSTEHGQFVVASILALICLPIAFLSVCTYAVYQYPHMIVRDGGMRWVSKFDFLFQRFRGPCYMFVACVLLRGLLIAITPVLFSTRSDVHLMIMMTVVATYGALQTWTKPWQFDIANMLDTGATVMLMLLGAAGGLLLDSAAWQVQQTASVFLYISMLAFVGVTLVVVLRFAFLRLRPPKTYTLFLSHHKGGAAVFARYMKEVLSDMVPGKIFLDSDELERLDLIFSVVAENTQVFVLLLTAETLSRLWCAVEIVAAVHFKVKTVLVMCDDYVPPTEEFLEQLGFIWTPEQQVTLAKQGCSLEDIRKAYRSLADMPTIRFRRMSSAGEQRAALQAVVDAAGLRQNLAFGLSKSAKGIATRTSLPFAKRWIGATAGAAPLQDWADDVLDTAEVVITSNTEHPEALCSCNLLQRLLQMELRRPVGVVASFEQARAVRRAQYVVVIVAPGLLESELFLGAFSKLVKRDVEVIPVLAHKHFSFPTSAFYEKLEEGLVLSAGKLAGYGLSLSEAASLHRRLFNILLLDFSTHGSKAILTAEVSVIARRFRFDLGASSKSSKKLNQADEVPASGAPASDAPAGDTPGSDAPASDTRNTPKPLREAAGQADDGPWGKAKYDQGLDNEGECGFVISLSPQMQPSVLHSAA